MNGCVAAISVDTGKVLDIEVMSSYCPTCKRLQTMPRNFEHESSKADHICQCNFTRSSSKMEIVGASRIFLRSEKNRRLHYTQYYGDGDSKAFMSVKDTYGLNSVTKFECIGHVQKRVGKVIEPILGRDAKVRILKLRYSNSKIIHPIQRVFPLEIQSAEMAESNDAPLDAEALKIPSANFDVSESAMITVDAPPNMPKVSRYGLTIQRPRRLNTFNDTTVFESE
ncbi:uncharacterized protein TNCV_2414371 [Trichonephila clavipes]|nr:uncharacterized protein TNCV_2414371 [Trichonephila clavipes]